MDDAATGATRLAELVDGIRVAMLFTRDEPAGLRGRPLTVQRVDDDATVWFLVAADAEWLDEIRNGYLGVAFVDGTTWVAASGPGELVSDAAVLRELGDPVSDAWFDDDRPPVALRVDVRSADYWDGPNRFTQLIGLGKAAVTGRPPDLGERGVVRP